MIVSCTSNPHFIVIEWESHAIGLFFYQIYCIYMDLACDEALFSNQKYFFFFIFYFSIFTREIDMNTVRREEGKKWKWKWGWKWDGDKAWVYDDIDIQLMRIFFFYSFLNVNWEHRKNLRSSFKKISFRYGSAFLQFFSLSACYAIFSRNIHKTIFKVMFCYFLSFLSHWNVLKYASIPVRRTFFLLCLLLFD